MKRKTLLFVVVGPEGYGVRHAWDLIFRALISADFEIVIAVLDRKFLDEWTANYPSASVVAPPFSWRAPSLGQNSFGKYLAIFKRGAMALRLVKWLRSKQADHAAVSIIFQSALESMLCGIVARSANIPAIWFVPNAIGPGSFLQINQRVYRFLFRYANVVPVSNSHFTDSSFGAGDFDRHVAHLGVDTEKFSPIAPDGAIRAKLGIPETAVTIGVFARLTPPKGQLRLLRAVARLDENIHLILCGGPTSGSYYDDLLAEASLPQLRDRVHFAGPQADLVPYYAVCDIICNLRIDPEPLGLSIIEAMACGRPVLAHALGGPSETIIDGETGWLLPDCDVDTITVGLKRALHARLRWADMGSAGRARAQTEFSLRRFKGLACAVVIDQIQKVARCSREETVAN